MTQAVEAVKAPVEWCLFYIDWEPICMPRSEWSGWAQAFGSLLALLIAIGIPYAQSRAARRDAGVAARVLLHSVHAQILCITTAQGADQLRHAAMTAEVNLRGEILMAERVPVEMLDSTVAQGHRQLVALARLLHDNVRNYIATKGAYTELFLEAVNQHKVPFGRIKLMILNPKEHRREMNAMDRANHSASQT